MEMSMQLGMIGLGRMGANMVERLLHDRHECVVFDMKAANVNKVTAEGAIGAKSLDDLVSKLKPPRVAWLMVPNGIEYGIMAAYAEGLNILQHANAGRKKSASDAETTPLRQPELYQYEFCLPDVAEVWRRGSVISSWLLDLTATELLKEPSLRSYAGRVSDSGEGRWTITAAIDEAVPAPVLSAALYERFSSRGNADFADRVLSAMRHEFGGHVEKAA